MFRCPETPPESIHQSNIITLCIVKWLPAKGREGSWVLRPAHQSPRKMQRKIIKKYEKYVIFLNKDVDHLWGVLVHHILQDQVGYHAQALPKHHEQGLRREY